MGASELVSRAHLCCFWRLRVEAKYEMCVAKECLSKRARRTVQASVKALHCATANLHNVEKC
jgi:hypothetical protein